MKRDERLLEELQAREIRAEHTINLVRAVSMGLIVLMDGWTLWRTGALGGLDALGFTALVVGLAVYLYVVHRLTRGPRYRPWLKYVTVAVDYGITVAFWQLFLALGWPPGLAPETLAGHIVGWLILVNLLSAFRAGRPVIAYSTVLGVMLATLVEWRYMDGATIVYPGVMLVMSGAVVWGVAERAQRMFLDLRRKEQLMRFLSRELVESVEAGEVALELGGEKRTVTVLLADIRGFTSLSESRDPLEVVTLLNEYFTEMTQVIFEQGGVIDKFIGDAILAVFGTPVSHGDDAARAVRAALGMRAALDRLNARWEAAGKQPLDIGVALHTGEVLAGNIGNPDRMEYTVIGDTVNLTSRIEGLNKGYGTWLLMSEATYAASGSAAAELVDEAAVRGRREPIRLFTVASTA